MKHEDRQFYFFHIPRTAGTTFSHSILTQYFKPEEICEPFDYQGLLKLPPEQLAKYRLFRGHFFYFFYRLLPKRPIYMCFLRNPLERIFSGYQLMWNDPTHYLHEQIRKLGSFEAYVDSIYMTVPNTVVRTIAADLDPRPIALHCRYTRAEGFYLDHAIVQDVSQFPTTAADLDVAKKRLDEFEFVGVQEHFADSLKLLVRTFDWKAPQPFETLNVSQTRHVELCSLSKRIRDQLASQHALDFELYDFAVNLFNERLRAERLDGRAVKPLPVTAKIQPTANTTQSVPGSPSRPWGRRFGAKPLYLLHVPFAIWPEISTYLEYVSFRPSEICRAWNYPELFTLPPELITHYRFFRGNFFYPLSSAIGREVERMTFLPEPISGMHRVYRFILDHAENPFHSQVKALPSFEAYAASMENPLVKVLSTDFDPLQFFDEKSFPSGDETIRAIVQRVFGNSATRNDLELAKQRLLEFTFVGLQDRFKDSIALLIRTFGCLDLEAPGRHDPALGCEELPTEIREASCRHFTLDLELYRFASDLFGQRLQAVKAPAHLDPANRAV